MDIRWKDLKRARKEPRASEGRAASGGRYGILAIGVAPDSHLAKEAGLELGIKGSIVVNDRMETQRRIFLQQAMLWK